MPFFLVYDRVAQKDILFAKDTAKKNNSHNNRIDKQQGRVLQLNRRPRARIKIIQFVF